MKTAKVVRIVRWLQTGLAASALCIVSAAHADTAGGGADAPSAEGSESATEASPNSAESASESAPEGNSEPVAPTGDGQPATQAEPEALNNCADAYEQAQTEKQRLHYKRARELAQLCSQLECSVSAITQECVKLYEQLGSEIPTLVFSARTWDGKALLDVKVSADGQLLVDRLDGSALAMDPGTYEFRFETNGQDPINATHVARVGDTNRLIEVVFGEAPQVTETPAEASAQMSTQLLTPQDNSIPVASYVLGGVGAVSLGVFAYLRFSGIQEYNRLNEACSPNCDEDEVDGIRSKFTLSWVPLGIGVAALAGAGAVYVFGRDTPSEAGAEVGLVPLQGGAGAHLRARF